MIPFYTLFWREIERFIRVWSQTFLPPVISAVLYVIVFGRFIGDRIGDVGGVSYIAFLIPGLVMMNVINSSYGGSSFSIFFSKWERTIHDVLTAPLSYGQMVLAILLGGGVVRAIGIGLAILGILALFGPVTLVAPLVAVFFLLTTSLAFAAFGMITGLWADRFDQFTIIQTFLITPLIYLGGVFYSIDTLPPVFQTLSRFNPMLYMVNGFRYGMTGVSDTPLWLNMTVVSGLAVVMTVACIALFRSGYKLRT